MTHIKLLGYDIQVNEPDYLIKDKDGNIVFSGDDYGASPIHHDEYFDVFEVLSFFCDEDFLDRHYGENPCQEIIKWKKNIDEIEMECSSYTEKLDMIFIEYKHNQTFLICTGKIEQDSYSAFKKVIDQGIDSHLEAFTTSYFKEDIKEEIYYFSFYVKELPLLLRRLKEDNQNDLIACIESMIKDD